MDFTNIKRRKAHQPLQTDTLSETYPCDLNMYKFPPENTITLTEFEDLAIDRLKVLRILEITSFKTFKYMSDDYKNFIKSELKKEGLKVYLYLLGFNLVKKEPDYQARRADHISHFILRLAYSRSQELRSWFLKYEMELFQLRFTAATPDEINKFFDVNGLSYMSISEEEKSELRGELMESTAGIWSATFDGAKFYKIRFWEVPKLVSRRNVFVQNGWAFVPNSELISCIKGVFRKNLNQGLSQCSSWVHNLDDFRINDFIANVQNIYTGRSFIPDESITKSINTEYIDYYARQHYPLCMQVIHDVFRTTHEMKHQCRLQYGLFLKGLGVSYEDAMRFWRDEYTKRITGEDFEKKYAYYVKHQYGKVGNRTNYSPYSCFKIIETKVGPGEHHGCPFRHWDPDNLKMKLTHNGIGGEGVNEILTLCKDKHYQVACNKYFELTHNQPSPNIITHPNQYFEESMNLAKGKDPKNGGKKQVKAQNVQSGAGGSKMDVDAS